MQFLAIIKFCRMSRAKRSSPSTGPRRKKRGRWRRTTCYRRFGSSRAIQCLQGLLRCWSAPTKKAEERCRQFPFTINCIAGLELVPLVSCTAYELLFEAQCRA